jgi:hypothetical protein
LVEFPLERGIVPSPELSEDTYALIAVGATPAIGVEPYGFEFLFHPSHAGAECDPSVGEDIEGGEHFGSDHWVAVGQD